MSQACCKLVVCGKVLLCKSALTSARVLSYRWLLHYFSTIPVGRIKIVTIYKRSIFQVEWLIATLILLNFALLGVGQCE